MAERLLKARWLFPALILLAALLRFQGLDWDAGRGLHPDEGNLVRAAAGLGWPDRLIPEFHAYNDLALWLPRLLALPFCDGPDCIRLAARALSAGFSVLTVWLLALIAGRLAGRGALLATALLAGLSVPLLQWAHFGTTESALTALVAALWLQSLRWLARADGDLRAALVTAVLLGLGFGFKTTALAFALIPLIALGLRGRPEPRSLGAVALAVPLTLALALVAAPSLIFDTDNWLAVMRFENGVVDGTLPVFWTRQFEGLGPLWHLRQLAEATGSAGLFLALAGLIALPAAARRGALPALVFAVIYLGLILGWHARFFRYFAPVLPIVLVFSGIGAAALLGQIRSQSLRMLGGLATGFLALVGLDFALSYRSPDPRLLAEAVLHARAAPGEVLAIEPHEVLLTGGFTTVTLPLAEPGRSAADLALAAAGADWLLIGSRRNWAVLPGLAGRNPEVNGGACGWYAALARGELGFRQVGRFTRASPLGRLSDDHIGREETMSVFDRPELFLFENDQRLAAAEIEARIVAAASDRAACTPAALETRWRRGR